MWLLAKGGIYCIYPVYGNLNAESDDSLVDSGVRYTQTKAFFGGKPCFPLNMPNKINPLTMVFVCFCPKM